MTAITALLGFTAWTILLILLVIGYRGVRILGGTPINHWPRRAKPADDPEIIRSLEDAHANCLENLPVFATIVLCAVALGKQDAIAALASYVLYARVLQTLTHMTGTTQIHVYIRATFWTIQAVLFVWMLVLLTH